MAYMIGIDSWGNIRGVRDPAHGMMSPYLCKRCHQVHDAAKVDVTARYQDCSVWKCPNCGASIDDRAGGCGGAEPYDRSGSTREAWM